MTRKIFIWEFVGLIGVLILWTILHNSYQNTRIMSLSLISAVNESIWEHVKIVFFSLFTLYIVEAFFIARYCKNFWYGKMMGLLTVIVTTLILFYVLTSIGLTFATADIIAGIVGFVSAQIISYRILKSEVNHSNYERIYMSLIVILIVPFFVFTFYPIKSDLFKDIITNAYGIFR
ncbi:hypothetical protein SH1V18_34160 [Vallitalea longa]|uniref:Uncharacterized protein n=1 Tax=Vallitalea longa TaxID=2936439 RepID=A0A9W5YDZ9_9FIRM|nr:DUF6512 family protein [Vallitalea longa]GKX30936.1 hypothetical protein SH1V18_34160 [Vallitalea longa]